jgi:hypothetical protein
MENDRLVPMSLQDMVLFCNPPDTMCLANFQLSLWDETIFLRPFLNCEMNELA